MIKKSGIRDRAVSICTAILIHVLLLFFAVFTIKTAVSAAAERPDVMKITDIQEELPKLPPSISTTTETVAEIMVESDDAVSGETYTGGGDAIDFLPMHLVSQLPRFSEEELKRRVIYPPIAQRSGIEGTVYLEVFVDREGLVRSVTVLKEDPPDRGFGESAQKAFLGLKGSPAVANGQEVAVRYRYPVRFTLR
ncbi:MAG: energy transducer TonB [Treponema sp.]|nr:energy transducer TonB [Treponema sp.]